MASFQITLHRMAIFFLILMLGAFCGRKKIISEDYLPNLQQLITKIFLPAVIFYGTYTGATRQDIIDNSLIIVIAAVFYVVVGAILFATAKLMRLEGDYDKGFTFCFLFGNTLFVGMPLLCALFPERGMLHLSLFNIIDQLVFRTFGIWLATSRERDFHLSLKNFATPNTVSLVLVFAFVAFSVPLPSAIADTMQVVFNGTGALCMLYLGALMYFSDWKSVLERADLYVGIILKMVVLPIIGGHILMLFGFSQDLIIAMVILMSLPVMTAVPRSRTPTGNTENMRPA